jgi:F-type H+-transporting ATPase subunit b
MPMATATSDHIEVPASEHGKSFPPFDANTFGSQLFWLPICFVLLYLLVSRLGLPRIAGILKERRGHIDGDLAEADRLKGEAETALADYRTALNEARARAQTIANEARDKLAAEAGKSRKAIEDRLHAKLAEAEKSIATTKAAAMASVRGIAVEAAAAIVARLTGVAATDKAVGEAVDSALKR